MRKEFFILAVVIILLLSGCSNCVDCEPHPWRAAREPEIVEFPNVTFPDGIIFETEFRSYAPDAEIISAIMTNAGTDPRFTIQFGLGFGLARQTENGWSRIPLEGGVQMIGIEHHYGLSHTFTLINGCVDWEVFYAPPLYTTNNLYTNLQRLAPGTYRIFKEVWTRQGYIWNGYIWAEFEIV